MHPYGQYCPVAKAAEVLGDRWTLLIVRDLISLQARHFNDLARGLPGISRSLLAQRLQHLERLGIVERHAGGQGRTTEYQLTEAGQELHQVIDALLEWGAQWAFSEPDEAELDPVLLLWWMRRGTRLDRLPPERVVLQFDFYGARTGSYWLLLEPSDVSVCLKHPGFDIDLLVTADIAAFYQVWLGRISFAEARRHELVQLDGLPTLVRAFPTWFVWSPAAKAVRTAIARGSTPEAMRVKSLSLS
jgi:DNA-binding HxlR family transcriptional regulator